MGRIYKDGIIPLYHQIKELFRERIISGEWEPGHQLPGEAELCKMFDVSRGTIRRAIMDLSREGLVRTEIGKGTFVARLKMEQSLETLYPFLSEMSQRGFSPSRKALELDVIPASKGIASKLDISTGTRIIQLKSLNFLDGEPIILNTVCMQEAVWPNFIEEYSDDLKIYDQLILKRGVSMRGSTDTIEPIVLDEYEAMILQSRKGSPGLLIKRVIWTDGRRPVVYQKRIFRGDICKFTINLPGYNL